MKFLLVGFGSIGRRHLRNLLSLGQKDIIVYHTGRSTLPEDELAGIPVVSDLQQALNQGVDAVIIANPTALHMDIAIPAAEAGCHILMEKPISHTLERTGALRQAMQTSGAKMLVGFQFRFHPGLQKIKDLLGSSAIGRVLAARAHWGEYLPGWHPWEDYRRSYSARGDLGGGVVLTLCHPLDYLRWLLGEVQSLSAYTAKTSDLELEVEDMAELRLGFANNTVASVHLNYFQRPPTHTLAIYGSEGTITWDNTDGVVHCYRSSSDAWEEYPLPTGFDRNDLFLAEMRHFIQVIRGEEEPRCTLEDGEKVLRICLAATSGDALSSLQ